MSGATKQSAGAAGAGQARTHETSGSGDGPSQFSRLELGADRRDAAASSLQGSQLQVPLPGAADLVSVQTGMGTFLPAGGYGSGRQSPPVAEPTVSFPQGSAAGAAGTSSARAGFPGQRTQQPAGGVGVPSGPIVLPKVPGMETPKPTKDQRIEAQMREFGDHLWDGVDPNGSDSQQNMRCVNQEASSSQRSDSRSAVTPSKAAPSWEGKNADLAEIRARSQAQRGYQAKELGYAAGAYVVTKNPNWLARFFARIPRLAESIGGATLVQEPLRNEVALLKAAELEAIAMRKQEIAEQNAKAGEPSQAAAGVGHLADLLPEASRNSSYASTTAALRAENQQAAAAARAADEEVKAVMGAGAQRSQAALVGQLLAPSAAGGAQPAPQPGGQDLAAAALADAAENKAAAKEKEDVTAQSSPGCCNVM